MVTSVGWLFFANTPGNGRSYIADDRWLDQEFSMPESHAVSCNVHQRCIITVVSFKDRQYDQQPH